jgi:hypothetical protein
MKSEKTRDVNKYLLHLWKIYKTAQMLSNFIGIS